LFYPYSYTVTLTIEAFAKVLMDEAADLRIELEKSLEKPIRNKRSLTPERKAEINTMLEPNNRHK
jgi:hypothetical protein